MSIKFFSVGKKEANQASINSRIASSETSPAFRAREILIKQNEINRRGRV